MIRLILLGTVIGICSAQTNTATINGGISDALNAPIAGASVEASHLTSGIRTRVETNEAGFYALRNLPIGSYSVTIAKPGFRSSVHHGISLTTSQILELNGRLEIGEITEAINVSGVDPLLNTRTAEIGQLLASKSIEALPLVNRRTMWIIQTSGVAAFVNNDNLPTYSLAGGRIQSQMVWIDGGTGQNMRLGPGQQNVDVPVEAVQEIKVLANNYPAEYGGSAGGVVIQTTKSGGNRFHGSGYEYLRNDAMDAPGYFAPVVNGAKETPKLRYNVFGATTGGPVRRNRTFFFAAYEGARRRTGSTTTLTVPTALERDGDFSRTLDNQGRMIPIYDPAGTPRQPFAGNAIPRDRLDPVGVQVVSYFPLPNRIADTIAGASNFRANNVTAVTGDFLLGKLDHRLDRKNSLTARYLIYRQDTDPASVYPDPAADAATHNRGRSQYAFASWTNVSSSAQVNDLRYTYVNRRSHVVSAGVGGDYPRRLGLTGVDPRAFPLFQFGAGTYSTIGSGAQERRQAPIEQHQVVGNIMLLKNRHALKAGAEARFSRNQEVNLPTISGAFAFNSASTGLPGSPATGNSLASLLLGLPTSFNQNTTPALDRHSWYLAGFLLDEWSATPGLTFNTGIRWEMDTPMIDANLRMNGFDPFAINPVSGTPGVVRFAGVNGYPAHANRFDANNVSPRFGFAWKIGRSSRMVLRGGYGIFFAHPFDSGQSTAASLGFSLAASRTSPDNGITPPFRLRDGVPGIPLASPVRDDSFGAVRVGQPNTTAVTWFDPARVSGYAHQFNLSLQHEFARSILVEAAVLGNLGRKLASATLNMNQIAPQILGPGHRLQSDRPFPQFGNVSMLAPSIGITNYYAGLIRVEKRFGDGLALTSTYTWSKFLGNTNDSANTGAGSLGRNSGPYSDFYNRRLDYGPLESDVEHRFTVSAVFELPFGKGHARASTGWQRLLAGGWTIGALSTLQSGVPLTAVTNTPHESFSAGSLRVNVARDPNLAEGERSLTRWFDTGAFSQPAAFAFGNGGVGIIRSAGWITADLSIMRNFRLAEGAALQFRGEFFNAANHTNLNPPNPIFGSQGFGLVNSSGAPRQIQVGMRVLF